MKKIISGVLIFTSVSSMVHAAEMTEFAVVRTDNNKAQIQEVKLVDLNSETVFDGKYFKVVKGKSDEAITINDSDELRLKAATTYYHLTRAREYFVNKIKSDYVAKQAKMVIRIEHTNQFSELGHFANDNFEPQYNNALTIPAGKGLASKGVKPWDIEIWFRPQKKLNISEIKVNNLGAQEFKGMLKSFRNQLHMQTLQRFFAQLVTTLIQNQDFLKMFSPENLIRTAGSSIIIEAGYLLIDPISKVFSRKWYWLDAALIPEVIYHEYSHAALSDYLVLSHSTAIIEGMADFFAGQISDSPTLAKNIKKYNTYNGKDAKRKQQYLLEFEMNEYANTDFVFGLLWELRNILGEDIGERFMFDLRKNLTTNSSIRDGLIEGILKTCDEKCSSPFNDKLRILKALNLRGI